MKRLHVLLLGLVMCLSASAQPKGPGVPGPVGPPGVPGAGGPMIIAPPEAPPEKQPPYVAWGFAAASSAVLIALVAFPSKEDKE